MNASLAVTDNVLQFRWVEAPPAAASREVMPGVIWLRMPLPFALDHINLWLLADGDGWTQVDCGYGNAATRGLWQQHFAGTLKGRPIRRVIATHYHYDKDEKFYHIRLKFMGYDVFGLDDGDLARFGAKRSWSISEPGVGITAWWQLQHQHEYAPLVTRFVVEDTFGYPTD